MTTPPEPDPADLYPESDDLADTVGRHPSGQRDRGTVHPPNVWCAGGDSCPGARHPAAPDDEELEAAWWQADAP